MTDQQPQRLSVSIHLSPDLGFTAPKVWPASADTPIAVVEIVENLRVQSDDKQVLRDIARAFLTAAGSVEALEVQQPQHYEVAGVAGPYDQESECVCGAFFTAPTHDLLREATAGHYAAVAS